ncbi:hypothetical protein V1478_015310 [Vespula squamosa]|uniref:Uncharacterized protein n=1 Tax=Vespula squamosa TaxID=30214 RepID=A0ABD2A5J9_VESSQ
MDRRYDSDININPSPGLSLDGCKLYLALVTFNNFEQDRLNSEHMVRMSDNFNYYERPHISVVHHRSSPPCYQ